jgi:hypothetical protein
MSSTESVDPKFRLHVSFAEADIDFVDTVLAALGQLDRFDLSVTPGGQDDAKDWVKLAGELIEAADAIVYVLSPASVDFPTVAYEAEKASALSKRMVPIVAQPLRKANLPAALSGLRPVRMETEQLFGNNFQQLLRLLNKDASWIQLHTQLYLRARTWQDTGHDTAYLLNSAEVAAAKAWTFERSTDAPKPTDLHMEFIETSEAAPMGLQNGARRAPPPATMQRARRKPKLATPETRIDVIEPATPCVLFELDEPAISIPTTDDALVLPEIAENAAEPTAPDAVADEDGHFGSPLQDNAPVPEAANAIAEEPIEQADPPQKKTARAKSKLGKLRRKRKAPVKAAAKAPAKATPPAQAVALAMALAREKAKPPAKTAAKASAKAKAEAPVESATKAPAKAEAKQPARAVAMAMALAKAKPPAKARAKTKAEAPVKSAAKAPAKAKRKPPAKAKAKPLARVQAKALAKSIAVDLDTLAYVPASLKISRARNDRPCPAPAKTTSLADAPMSKVPDVMEKPETPPDIQAAEIKPTEDVAKTPSPQVQAVTNANASAFVPPAKSAKAVKRPHPVIIAQDELDGLLSSLMADADNDRS